MLQDHHKTFLQFLQKLKNEELTRHKKDVQVQIKYKITQSL